MLSLPNGTLLVITPLSGATALQLTPYAARGLTQTYEPIKPTNGVWTRQRRSSIHRRHQIPQIQIDDQLP
jgi:hypothetical protein